MWLVIMCFVNVHIGYSLVNGDIVPGTCQPVGENVSTSEESATTIPPQGSCFISSSSSGVPETLPQDQLNPRYTRAVIEANSIGQQNPNGEKLRIQSRINQEERSQDPEYSRVMQTAQQNTFTPQGNIGYYRPSEQEGREDSEGPPDEFYSRPLYPAYDGSFAPPISYQVQSPTINFNQGNPPSHHFGARSCPYCNSHLPAEPVYQMKMPIPRYNQFQQNPQFLANQFNQQQQHPFSQEQAGYPNVIPVVKTSPTLATEEMCPYDNGPPEVSPSPSSGYNQTLQHIPDVRRSPGAERPLPPPVGNPPPYLAVKNLQSFPQGPGNPKIPSQQSFKYMKMQRSESAVKKVDSN